MQGVTEGVSAPGVGVVEESTSLPGDWGDSGGGDGISNSLKTYRVFVCLVGVVGVLGNGLVFIVMVTHPKLRKLLTSTLIANQSLVDMVCGLSLTLTYGYKSAPIAEYRGRGRELLCFLFHNELLLFCALNASTYCLVVITLERYLMIVAPIYHRNSFTRTKAIMLAAVAWVAGFLWNGVPTGVTTLVSASSGRCVIYNYTSYRAQQLFGYVYIAATFFAPMLLFGAAYGHMLMVLRRRVRQVATTEPASTAPSQAAGGAPGGGGKTNNLSRAQVNLTKTMVLVTAGFALCWTPNQIHYLLFNMGVLVNWGGEGYTVTLFLAFLNCCVNPFIYAVKYDGFRAALAAAFACSYRGSEGSGGGSAQSNVTSRTGV